MKRGLWIAACMAAVILVAGLCVFWYTNSMFNSHDAAWYADYTAQYGDLLKQIADEKEIRQPSFRTKWILNRGRIESIHFDPDRTLFFLKTAILEGYYMIAYAPDGSYVPRALGSDANWQHVETEDGSSLWEGSMQGEAYVRLYDLGNGFYLEEACLPT